MDTARIFMLGNSQEAQLPKTIVFDSEEVVLKKAVSQTGAAVFDALQQIPNDVVYEARQDSLPQTKQFDMSTR